MYEKWNGEDLYEVLEVPDSFNPIPSIPYYWSTPTETKNRENSSLSDRESREVRSLGKSLSSFLPLSPLWHLFSTSRGWRSSVTENEKSVFPRHLSYDRHVLVNRNVGWGGWVLKSGTVESQGRASRTRGLSPLTTPLPGRWSETPGHPEVLWINKIYQWYIKYIKER